MSLIAFDSLSAWAMLLSGASHFAAGIALGILYFRGLWWNVRLFGKAGQVLPSIALMLGRIIILVGLLTLASLEGALPLLLMALGVFIARFGVMRRVRTATS